MRLNPVCFLLVIGSWFGALANLEAAAAPSALATTNAARERLEMLGWPAGADVFARAVATSHAPLIDLCFAAHLDPNAAGAQGRTPLLLASLEGNVELMRRLLDAGAQVEAADSAGLNPLMAAAMCAEIAPVKFLLEKGAHPDAVDQLGRTALHYAVAAQQAANVDLLLPLTPNFSAPEADGRNILAIAFEVGDEKITQTLLQQFPANLEWTPATRQALTVALQAGDQDQIRLLLKKHATPPTAEGRTTPMLAYAVAMEDESLFNLLLASGTDPNTVLPKPVDKEFLALLPANYLRHYIEEDSNITVLMLAAGLGKMEYTKSLLAAGADRNRSTPKWKMLALYFATRTESWECTQLLLGTCPKPEQLRIEISLADQRAVVIKDGLAIYETNVSTGRSGYSTPSGRFVITDKNRDHRSTIYKVPMPFFMRLNCRDFGLHAGVVPNHPASHGCIRVPSAAARKLFSEIPLGTLVTIN